MSRLLIILIALQSPFVSHGNDCEERLKLHEEALLRFHGNTPSLEWDATDAEDRQTVSIAERYRDPLLPIGWRYLLYRTGNNWYSNFSTVPRADRQGDPRSLPMILDDLSAARLFGYERVDPRRWLVPGGRRFSAGIHRVNNVLHRRGLREIPIQFQVGSEQFVKNENPVVVSKYGKHGIILVGSGGHPLVHDVGFHYPSIGLPPYVFDLSRARMRHIIKLLKFAQKEGKRKIRETLVSFVEQLLAIENPNLDVCNGNASLALGQAIFEDDDDRSIIEDFYDAGFKRYTASGRSPKDFLRELRDRLASARSHQKSIILETGRLNIPKPKARKYIVAMIDEYLRRPQRFRRDPPSIHKTPDQFLEDTLNRIREISDSAILAWYELLAK